MATSSNRAYMCGVPRDKCCGSLSQGTQGMGKAINVHSSPVEAFNCYANYLISQGYERIGSREFRPPNGGPIQVLTKKSRFGGMLRSGKTGETGKTGGNRYVAKKSNGRGGTSCVIVST
jgi:hypothetical protein